MKPTGEGRQPTPDSSHIPLVPHAESLRLARVLAGCADQLISWSGTIYRASAIEYANSTDLISGVGSQIYGGRWNPRGDFPVVYGCFEPQTALLEMLGTGGKYGVPYEQRMPLVMVAVRVKVEAVLDHSDARLRRRLRLTLDKLLSEDWVQCQQQGVESLSQTVARLARSEGAQALIVPSTRLAQVRNLVLFADRVEKGGMRILGKEKLPEVRPR